MLGWCTDSSVPTTRCLTTRFGIYLVATHRPSMTSTRKTEPFCATTWPVARGQNHEVLPGFHRPLDRGSGGHRCRCCPGQRGVVFGVTVDTVATQTIARAEKRLLALQRNPEMPPHAASVVALRAAGTRAHGVLVMTSCQARVPMTCMAHRPGDGVTAHASLPEYAEL
jgi:hypothetical protein